MHFKAYLNPKIIAKWSLDIVAALVILFPPGNPAHYILSVPGWPSLLLH